jgi:hypothetical protein
MAGNIKITRLITLVLGAFWVIFLLLGGGAWWALSDSGKSLRDVHDNHMARSESMAQLALAVEGERLEIMRAFQHDPTSPLVKLHDHPVDSHFKTAQAREDKVVALWKDLQAKACRAKRHVPWKRPCACARPGTPRPANPWTGSRLGTFQCP